MQALTPIVLLTVLSEPIAFPNTKSPTSSPLHNANKNRIEVTPQHEYCIKKFQN